MDYYNEQTSQTERTVLLNGKPINPTAPQQAPKPPKKNHTRVLVAVFISAFIIAIIAGVALLFFNIVRRLPYVDADELLSSLTETVDDSRGTVPYSEMEYARPDSDAIFSAIDNVEEACEYDSYDAITEQLDKIYSAYWHFDTMYNLADLRSCIDATDEYYYNECLYFSENYPILDQKMDDMMFVLSSCPIAEELSSDYYQSDSIFAYTGESYYGDELVTLYQKESDLVYEYKSLVSYPQIMVDGIETPFMDYIYEIYDDDEAYNAAFEQYYDEYNESVGNLYIELVQTRQAISEYLGYDSYINYAYAGFSRDYAPQDVQEYIHDVCMGCVPIYKALSESGELEEYYYADYLSEEDNFSWLKSACKSMGGDIESIFNYMDKYELYDISPSDYKLNTSFQTYLEDWNAPFIMLYATQGTDDYISFAHEFGHFIDSYINYNYNITTDATEACSQSMEYLAAIYSGSASADILNRKMIDTVELYAVQGAYNAFEEAVYSLPSDELTLDTINQLAEDIFADYGISDDTIYSYSGKSWIDVSHFFSSPFYIVSYIVSNDSAFQIYQMELSSPGEGLNTFMALADRDWDLTYLENVDAIGLDSSLTPEKAAGIVESLYQYFN